MRVGLISGTGGYDWPGLEDAASRTVRSAFGEVTLAEGHISGVEVVQLCRHGVRHARLSNQVAHRANLQALADAGVDAVISTTVCGAVDRSLALGTLVVFDDLYFPSNRLPDGTLCTWHEQPGVAGRGHWIFDRPFSEPLRHALVDAAVAIGAPIRPEGCYGHADGPRFNSLTEISALASVGVSAVSQTLGPEVVLAGEAELAIAAVGYVTDFANGINSTPEPMHSLSARLAEAPRTLAAVIAEALERIDKPTPAGSVFRFDP